MPLYEKFVGRNRDDFATLEDLQKNYKVTVGDDFNYSYDVVDVIAKETPDKLAMLWVSNGGRGAPLHLRGPAPPFQPDRQFPGAPRRQEGRHA